LLVHHFEFYFSLGLAVVCRIRNLKITHFR
jgi:hypothetical protein